jgi:prepilin-type N-terminal cleavage/methylation domain-containing protein
MSLKNFGQKIKKVFRKQVDKAKGFTLIEVILMLAIISVLAGIVVVAINPGKQLAQGRNAERTSELHSLHNAMVQFYTDHRYWPASTTLSSGLTDICATGYEQVGGETDCEDYLDLRELVPDYLQSIPSDPNATNTNSHYRVAVNGDNNLSMTSELSTEYSLSAVTIATTSEALGYVAPPSGLAPSGYTVYLAPGVTLDVSDVAENYSPYQSACDGTPTSGATITEDGFLVNNNSNNTVLIPISDPGLRMKSGVVMLWYKDVNTVTNNYNNVIFSWDGSGYGLSLREGGSTVVDAIWQNGTNPDYVNGLSAGSYADGNWHHIALVFTSDYGVSQPNLTLYIDGVQTATYTHSSVTAGIRQNRNYNELWVGNSNNTCYWNRPMNAWFDHFVVYDADDVTINSSFINEVMEDTRGHR